MNRKDLPKFYKFISDNLENLEGKTDQENAQLCTLGLGYEVNRRDIINTRNFFNEAGLTAWNPSMIRGQVKNSKYVKKIDLMNIRVDDLETKMAHLEKNILQEVSRYLRENSGKNSEDVFVAKENTNWMTWSPKTLAERN